MPSAFEVDHLPQIVVIREELHDETPRNQVEHRRFWSLQTRRGPAAQCRNDPCMAGVLERADRNPGRRRSEEHTSELQSLMRISYAVFCLKKKKNTKSRHTTRHIKLQK